MKVLVIPTWYFNGTDKLIGVYHKEFVEALNNNGISADILYIDRQRLKNPIKYIFIKKKEIYNEINFKVNIYRILNFNPISFNLGIRHYVRKLESAFKDYLKHNNKPDIIHAHVTVPAGYAACIIGKKYNIPVVVTEHYSKFLKFYEEENLKKYSNFVFKNSTYSTVSNYMKKEVLKYTDQCYVIPNLVDTKIFNNEIKRKKRKIFKLVSICALREGKKIDIALQAIKILKDKKINVHLDIIGDGYYEIYYKGICSKLSLDKEVTFLGRKDKTEIAKILKEENALLISSQLESFTIPGIEAMASGLPIVSTDCLGPTEYINSKNGVICKVNDPVDMADKIIYLIDNYEKYDSKYIMKCAQNYSGEKVVSDLKVIYNNTLVKNKRTP